MASGGGKLLQNPVLTLPLLLLPQEAFEGQEPHVHQADPVLAGEICGCFRG